MGKRRRFERSGATRPYRRLFVIATEGAETEPQYFDIFNNTVTTITIKCLKSRTDSSPQYVLKRMERYLSANKLRAGDAAWLVVDKDQWNEDQLLQLHEWAGRHESYGLAVSNPAFELWLLLHFIDGAGVTSLRQCKDRLKRYIPDYDKGDIEVAKLIHGISPAIDRARQKDWPPCSDWPRSVGTTVYRLVEKLREGQPVIFHG